MRGPRRTAREEAAAGGAMTADGSPEAPVTYRGTVYPWQCDHIGHMNIMWYVGKFDEANWNFFAGLGLTPSYLRRENRGMAAVQLNTTYLRELHAGDVVAVRSHLVEMREKVVRVLHEMVDDETGEVAARAELTAVHIDQRARRACAIPKALRDRARKNAPAPADGAGVQS